MKKVMSGLFGMMVCMSLGVVATRGDDIEVVVPGRPSPRVRAEEIAKVRKADEELDLPRKGFSSLTIGELCKASLLVAVGRVESAREREIDTPDFPGTKPKTVDLTIRISEALAGKAQGGKVSFTFGFPFNPHSVFSRPLPPEKPPETKPGVPQVFIPEKPVSPDTWIGTEILVFLTDKVFDFSTEPRLTDWSFDRATAKERKAVPLQPTWGEKSVIALTDDTREEMLSCVREYVRLQSAKDAGGYKAFLARQIESPVQRFSDDAVWDMIYFMRSYYTDKEELKKASQDPQLDKRVRGYFEVMRLWEAIPKE